MVASSSPIVTFLVLAGDFALPLQECLRSILAQSFIDLEVLILDTALHREPTELSQQVSRRDDRVRHLVLPSANTRFDSWNHGLRQAKGELIWLLEPTDRLASPQAIKDCVTQFILNPRLGLLFSRVQYLDDNGVPIERYAPPKKNSELPYHPTLYPGRLFFRQLLKANLIPAGSVIARKACFNRAGGFQNELGHSSAWQLWLRFSLDWQVYFDPVPKLLSRQSTQEASLHQGKSRQGLHQLLQSFLALQDFMAAYHYPKPLQHQVQLARLQFMRRKGIKLSVGDQLLRFYRKLTTSGSPLSPLLD